MSDIDVLKKEVEILKKDSEENKKYISSLLKTQKEQNKRIYDMQNFILKGVENTNSKKDVDSNIIANSIDEEKKRKTKFFWAIILIIVGSLLCLSIIGALLGIPLLIWGIVLASKNSKTEEDNEDIFYEKEKQDIPKEKQKENKTEIIKKKEIKTSTQKKKTKKPTFEEDVGMKWFSRIGILALVIGIGFFIKYAIDMNWINHMTRIIMGVVFGIGLIVAGEIISKKEKRFHNWGKTLVGGGFAITYFIVYAAYHFKEYRNTLGISQTVDILLLAIVVLFAVYFSVKEDSQIIAAESFFLGYVTSLLSNDFGLMAIIYGLLLTIGLVIVVAYKKWAVIGIGGLIASYFLFGLWFDKNINNFGFGLFMLLSYFIAFTIQSFFLKADKKLKGKNIAIILLNSGLFYFFGYWLVQENYPDFGGLFTLCLSIFYFACYYLTKNDKEEIFKTSNAYLGILYLTLAIPIQLNHEWVTIIWALQALMMTIMFLKTGSKTLKISTYVVSGITAGKTFIYDSFALDGFDLQNIIASTRLVSFFATIICFYLIYRMLKKNIDKLEKTEKNVPYIYSWVALMAGVLILFIELSEHQVWITLILCSLSLLLMSYSKDAKEFKYQSFTISIILALKLLLYDSHGLEPFSPYDFLNSTRLFAFLASAVCFYSISAIIKARHKSENTNNNTIIPIIYSWVGLCTIILSMFLELNKYHMWITIILASIAMLLMFKPKDDSNHLKYQSIVLSVILFIKVLLYDSWDLNAFNSVDFFSSSKLFAFLAAMACFYSISWYLYTNKSIRIKKMNILLANIYSFAGTILAFIFVLIELEEFWISVGWSVLAVILMMIGLASRVKQLRLQGMIIFAITIVKVFLYDTRNLETVYRTISYIVLGVLLLSVSFIYTKFKEKLKELL